MRTKESEEMYLETILLLQRRKPEVRSVDVVEELGFAKSSVSFAVHLLEKRGYLTMNEIGVIRLTEEGRAKAESIYERHRVITELFTRLGADEKLAEQDACRIEHVISPEMFELIKRFVGEDPSVKN